MTASAHRELADKLISALGAAVFERVDIPPRSARYLAPPTSYQSGPTGAWLREFLGGSSHPYRHQSLALEQVEAGRNLVISTATASGKSLVFMAAAMNELIERDGTVLALYPLKALGSDQHSAWRCELARAGLRTDLVGEITGDVPMAERLKVLETARVILATPDVINAWLMPMTSTPDVRQFLGRLALVIIDEAHSLEAVFGSQFALFFRRLRAAHRKARSQ